MVDRSAHLSAFEAHARGPTSLDRGAALIACHEQPWLDPDDLLAGLDQLARLHLPEGAELIERVARLNHHLFTTHAFGGDRDDYYAPVNSLLDRVLERRRGMPILLSLVTIEVARRVGLSLLPIGFPGHFLVGVDAEPRFYVDPFEGGAVRRREELLGRLAATVGKPLSRIHDPDRFLDPVRPRAVLVRINRNLKACWLRRNDLPGALRATERLLALQPDAADQLRDRAVLLAKLDRVAEALPLLERYLERAVGADDAAEMAQLLAHLKTRV